MTTPTLGAVPSEIVLDIAGNLDVTALNSLLQTGRRFHNLLHSRLYQLAHIYRNVPGAGTPLIWAVQTSTTSVLKRLVGGDKWPSDKANGTTALHQAILLENETALRLLLNAGADTLAEDAAGDSPLMMAVKVGNEPAVRLIIDAHMKTHPWPDIRPEWKRVLTRAVSTLSESVCKVLLDAITDTQNTGLQEDLNWVLHGEAGRRGDCVIIQLLCDFGANPLAASPYPTLLSSAAACGHVQAIKLALNYGIDPNATDHQGETALHYAAQHGQLESIQLLIASGVRIDTSSRGGMTPLLSAASKGHKVAAESLLDAGADIHARTRNGFNVVELAIGRETSVEMVELFLQRGANASLPYNHVRMTPLHWAARMGGADLVRLLCGAGVKVDTLDQRGRTALHLATRQNHPATVTALLRAGADPSSADETGTTPLHMAGRNGITDVTRLLLAARANVAAINDDQHTPFHLAARAGNIEICQILLQHGQEHGIDFANQCPERRMLLAVAMEHGYTDIVKILR